MNIAIAQSDVVTAYGWGLDALWNGLLSNQTAIRTIVSLTADFSAIRRR